MNTQSASKNVDVSVIIPAYRSAATIGRALDSVIAQTVKPIEVIVVVDGLADETYQLALNYEKKMGGISFIVLSQQRKGAGAARNKAISEARGKFVAFLDADDEWLIAEIRLRWWRIRNVNGTTKCPTRPTSSRFCIRERNTLVSRTWR